MTRKPLEQHRDLSFRISLARSTLQVDSTPTSRSVTSFALHLIAEFEQVVYHESQSSKKLTPAPKEKALKMKKLEAEDEKGGSRMRDGEQEGNPPKCKFFLTASGCKKGKDCKFSHDQKDDQRRCYICGSSEHVVPGCPRRKADQPRQPPKAARIEANDEHPREEETSGTATTTDEKPGEPTVKGRQPRC